MIKVYYCVDTDLESQRVPIQDDFIKRCMDLLESERGNEHMLNRVLQIIKSIIIEAEKKGTSDVRPHSSLLRGELLEKMVVKNRASPNITQLNIAMYSNTTFWELKRQVAEKVGLAPRYLKLLKSNSKPIKDTEHGKTLGELGFQSGEVLIAEKLQITEDVVHAPLIG